MSPISAFPWYLTSASLWMAAISLQGFLVTWMLVGMLATPADQVGFARMLMEIPGLAILLIGGVLADRVDGRALLTSMHLLVAIPPLAVAVWMDALSYWLVVAFGVSVAALQAMSDPARQAMLNRITRTDIQRSVTIMTIITSLAGLIGVWIGGRMESLGLVLVLIIQATLFGIGAATTRLLPALPATGSAPQIDLLAGLKATWRQPLVRNIIGLNFISSLFNAGAYIVAIPFIVTEVYAGDAAFFATVMIVFTTGSIGSNVVLLRFMPLLLPGRVFLLLQLTRIVILAVLWWEPSVWLFYAAIGAWGLNMGITSTLARATVQELAPATHRAQILALFILSFLVSAAISSPLLGLLIAGSSPLAALVPGMVISLVIFFVGIGWSGLWGYRSVSVHSLAEKTRPTDPH